MGQTGVGVRVLGGFEVVVDGTPIGDAWPSRRSSELVQLLAITQAHRLTRDEVIEALWPHLPADAGAANLRKAAHHARRVLGADDAVVLRQQHVALFPGAEITSDLDVFLAAADDAIGRRDAGAAARAASLYCGELLPDARYEPWAERSRRIAADRHLEVLRIASRWEQLIELDPTDEAACREAMRAALDDGQRHRAIALFGRLREALRIELGVLPEPDTDELYREAHAALLPARRTIVGRHRELAALDAMLHDAAAGATLAVVRGAVGIGKTALCREVAARASDAGMVTVSVTADDPNDAYATMSLLVERLVEGRGEIVDALDAKTRSVLSMVSPLAGDVAPLELPLTRHQMVGAAQRLIEAVGRERGLAIVIDDLERADESSLGVLALLGDRDVGRLLVVVAHREPSTSAAVDRALARAARIRPPVVWSLGLLDPVDAESLARHTNPELDDASVSMVLSQASGVPFFVVELAGSSDATAAADGIRGVVESRFVELAPHEVAWLRRLAIVGGPLDLDAILALTGCADDESDLLLDHALDAGVLVVDDDGYRFSHEIVREALADRLPLHQRAAVHRDAARRLAELGARPGRIAGHWSAGHRPAEAADWFVKAADEAIRLGGYAAAVVFSGEALGLVADHGAALRRRAQALDALGDPRTLSAYEAAIAVATAADVQELRPLQALAQIKQGDPHGAVLTAAGAEPRSLESKLAQALTMSGAALLGATGPEVGTRLSAAGRELALRSGDPAAVVVASWSQAAVAHARGELRESLQADLADTHAIPRLAVTVFDGQLCITQRLLYGNRPYDDVIRFTNDFAAEAERLGAARGVAFATTLRGEAELLSGRLTDADRDLREGARLHHEMGAATGESFSLQRLAELAWARGEADEARRLLDEALEIARISDVGFHLFDRIYGTRIQLAPDPAAALDVVIEAEEAVRGPFETCPGCRITLDVPAAIAVARAGDVERLERYERSCTFLADVVMQLPAWYAALEEVRAHGRLARGDRSGAAMLFADAASGFEQVGQPLDARRCAAHAAGLVS